ncbi:hypothetical protein RHSIM_Rhsim07G0240700 [Rhododendron simsii]|uniref:Uncharacterized protein n=1 Tax=Rhododendron simsii TaxID=118357 RepID=A0A834LID5_RHOSS|nr:hypothetical protein RHSIM_Rhsim07G0240700 [Rhododendron simsii]
MGSLMAGWNSPVRDPRTVKLERNKSLTKEGIEAYWRSRKKVGEEQARAISEVEMKRSQESIAKESERSLLSAKAKEGDLGMETQMSLEEFLKKTGWWSRTSSAFLNEPPVIAADQIPAYKYASQFHVTGTDSHSLFGITT